MPLRLGIAHQSAGGVVVVAKTGAGQLVHDGLGVGRGGVAAVGVVAFAEYAQITVGAVALHNQQPKQRCFGLLRFDAAHQAAPGQRQGLLAPKRMVDDGVAGKHRPRRGIAVHKGNDFEGAEAAHGVGCVLQQQDVVFFEQVAAEQRGAGASVIACVECKQGVNLAFRQPLRRQGAGVQSAHDARCRGVAQWRYSHASQPIKPSTSALVMSWLARCGGCQSINHNSACWWLVLNWAM